MNFVRSNSLSLKYQRNTSSECKDIGTSKFVAKKSIPLSKFMYVSVNLKICYTPGLHFLLFF